MADILKALSCSCKRKSNKAVEENDRKPAQTQRTQSFSVEEHVDEDYSPRRIRSQQNFIPTYINPCWVTPCTNYNSIGRV